MSPSLKDYKQYVLGFAFLHSGRVVLVCKERPEWQKGLLNGVGGKVEPGETFKQAMVREFKEETGVETTEEQWIRRGSMMGQGWLVDVFATELDVTARPCTVTDEEIVRCMPEQLGDLFPCIENVPALIALCKIPVSQPSGSFPLFSLVY